MQLNNWQEKISKVVNKILNLNEGERIRFGTFIVERQVSPGWPKWVVLSAQNENVCRGVLYADNYDNDEQFTNDLIGLIF